MRVIQINNTGHFSMYHRSSTGKDMIIPDPDKSIPDEGKPMHLEKRSLPSTAVRLYGCVNCEWKDTELCEFEFKTGKGNHTRKNTHTNGICPNRRNYLLSFSDSDKKIIPFKEWQED